MATPGTLTFYHMLEEAQFVADVMKAAPANGRVLWGLDREICEALLGALVDAHFLRRTPEGAFARLTASA
mgnify:CR=1 FL=1